MNGATRPPTTRHTHTHTHNLTHPHAPPPPTHLRGLSRMLLHSVQMILGSTAACAARAGASPIASRLTPTPTHTTHGPRAQNCRSLKTRIPDSQTVSMMILVTLQNDGQCDLNSLCIGCSSVCCGVCGVCGVVRVECLCACLWVCAQCRTRRLRRRWRTVSTQNVPVLQLRRSQPWRR